MFIRHIQSIPFCLQASSHVLIDYHHLLDHVYYVFTYTHLYEYTHVTLPLGAPSKYQIGRSFKIDEVIIDVSLSTGTSHTTRRIASVNYFLVRDLFLIIWLQF